MQCGGLKLRADEPFRLSRMRAEIQPVDLNRTLIGPAQSEDTLEGGCFTGAVRTQQSEDLSRPDFEADAANRGSNTVSFR